MNFSLLPKKFTNTRFYLTEVSHDLLSLSIMIYSKSFIYLILMGIDFYSNERRDEKISTDVWIGIYNISDLKLTLLEAELLAINNV